MYRSPVTRHPILVEQLRFGFFLGAYFFFEANDLSQYVCRKPGRNWRTVPAFTHLEGMGD